jgi:hypothetical protein
MILISEESTKFQKRADWNTTLLGMGKSHWISHTIPALGCK